MADQQKSAAPARRKIVAGEEDEDDEPVMTTTTPGEAASEGEREVASSGASVHSADTQTSKRRVVAGEESEDEEESMTEGGSATPADGAATPASATGAGPLSRTLSAASAEKEPLHQSQRQIKLRERNQTLAREIDHRGIFLVRSLCRSLSQITSGLARAEKNAQDFSHHVRVYQTELRSIKAAMERIDMSHLPKRDSTPVS